MRNLAPLVMTSSPRLYRSDEEFGETLGLNDRRHVPLRFFLQEISERYARPLIIAETSTEYDARMAHTLEQLEMARA